MKDRTGPDPALTFEELYVNASLGSLFRLAPVLDQIRLVKPHLRIVRNEDKTYNFQDLIDEALNKLKTEGPPPKLALYNIACGRPGRSTTARAESAFGDGVRSASRSSRPSTHPEINVQPLLAAKVNGAPFQLVGETRPFHDTRQTSLKIELDALQLPKYLDYSPVPIKFKLTSGQLDTKLTLTFTGAGDKPQSLTLSGDVALSKIVVQDLAGAPVSGCRRSASQSVLTRSSRADEVGADRCRGASRAAQERRSTC
jgi:hypothetical protein